MNSTSTAPELLATQEAATALGMGVRSFTVARSSGALQLAPATRRGARWYYLATEVEAVREERAAGRDSGPCRVADCPLRGARSRDFLCREHAALVAQLGARVEELRGRPSPARRAGLTPAERFASRVRVAPTGCALWVGSRISSGYGNCWDGTQMRKAHVLAFELAAGRPVREDKELDHECEDKLCVRIGSGHVVETTHAENMRRMARRAAAQRAAAEAVAAELLPFPSPARATEPAPVKPAVLRCAA